MNLQLWNGVVEDRNDPAKLGRCKVRIFGWHSEDLQLMPTKDLPWASIVLAPNGSSIFSVPDEGSYVVGYFQDGRAAQMPIVIGVIPGILTKKPNKSKGFSPQGEQFKREEQLMPPGEREGQVGQPQIRKIFGGELTYTKLQKSNNNLDHACDVNFFLDLDLGLNELANPIVTFQQAIRKGKANAANMISLIINKTNEFLREAVNLLIDAMGLDFSGAVSYTWTWGKAQIRKINETIKKAAEYVEVAAMVTEFVKQISTLIEYFKSLPEKFVEMLKACVAQFGNSIMSIFNQLKALPGSSGFNNLQDILDSFSGQTQSTTTTAIATVGNTSIDLLSTKLTANTVRIYINGALTEQTNNNTTLANSAFNPKAFQQP